MITSPSNVESIILYGIIPDEEKFLSKVDDNILEGDYFSDDNIRDIIIGEKMAKVLEVTIGDRIVITVAQAFSGDLGQDMFRVSGIYRFGVNEMDNGMAFIRLDKAQQMLNLKNKIHEIAINFTDLNFAGNKNADFWQKYSKGQNEAVSWVKILPELNNMLEMSNLSMAIMGMILFVVVVFGIINTLFMSLYERMFEFGILRAVGTRPSGIRKLIIFESAVLAFISIIIGVILGFIVMMMLVKWGIDYRGIEISGAVMSDMLYPVVELRQFFIYPVFVFIFTVLIGLYPAFVAGKIVITDALRKSL
jgi:ABC-type lipoprotein release transport system permease subunit